LGVERRTKNSVGLQRNREPSDGGVASLFKPASGPGKGVRSLDYKQHYPWRKVCCPCDERIEHLGLGVLGIELDN
jgi:hypothetical protein